MRPPTGTGIEYSANLSILFADLPLEERAAAAAAHGFHLVESWWPFERPTADAAEISAFCRSLEDAGVQLVLLNLYGGSLSAGERGILTDPGAEAALAENLTAVCAILERTGCKLVNALFGNRQDPSHATQEDRLALDRIVQVADRIGEFGATAVIEMLNSRSSPRYPLTDIAKTVAIVAAARQRSRFQNTALLLDTFHLATMGVDPVEAIREYGPLIGHVQFADSPGRGRPGTGLIDFEAVRGALREIDYPGVIGLEYEPHFQTPDTGTRV